MQQAHWLELYFPAGASSQVTNSEPTGTPAAPPDGRAGPGLRTHEMEGGERKSWDLHWAWPKHEAFLQGVREIKEPPECPVPAVGPESPGHICTMTGAPLVLLLLLTLCPGSWTFQRPALDGTFCLPSSFLMCLFSLQGPALRLWWLRSPSWQCPQEGQSLSPAATTREPSPVITTHPGSSRSLDEPPQLWFMT